MNGELNILDDLDALVFRTADWFVAALADSTGPFRINLSGGPTPEAFYRHLASDARIDERAWERTNWYWGDERFVPHDHPESNFRMVHEALLSKVPVPAANIMPMPVDGTPEDAANRYEHALQRTYGSQMLDPQRPFFDLSIYGLGPDGHTASLLVDQPVLTERTRWVTPVPRGRPEIRITLTYPMLESSRRAAFLVSGPETAPVLREIRAGTSRAPAASLCPVGELLWFVDHAAATGP